MLAIYNKNVSLYYERKYFNKHVYDNTFHSIFSNFEIESSLIRKKKFFVTVKQGKNNLM